MDFEKTRDVVSENNIVVFHSCVTWLPLTSTWLFNQVSRLPEQIENHVVCERAENLDQFDIPNLHILSESPYRRRWDNTLRRLHIRRQLGYLTKKAKMHNAQILHSHYGHKAWANIPVAKQANLKHVVTFYGFDVNYIPTQDKRWYRRYKDLFNAVDIVLCEGPFMAKTIESLGCPSEKVQVHHLGIMVDDIDFVPRIWNQASPLRVLIAATFTEKKGIPLAIEALGRLRKETPLEVTIIGDSGESPRRLEEKKKILLAIDNSNLRNQVRLLGFQPRKILMNEAYNHHVFLSPSQTAADGDTEGGAPVTLIEMAATGMPVVATRHCDIPEVIIHEETGLLGEEQDSDGVLRNLRWLVNHPGDWTELVTKGRRRIEMEFDARVQGRKLSRYYVSLLN